MKNYEKKSTGAHIIAYYSSYTRMVAGLAPAFLLIYILLFYIKHILCASSLDIFSTWLDL